MAQSVLTVALVWLVVQVGVNALQAAATALVPDRYPAARRGGVSAMIGVGITIGNAVGVVVAGGTASQGMLPYVVLAALVLVIIGGFVLVNRDEPSTHLPRQRTGGQGVPPRLLGRPAPAPRLRLGVRVALPHGHRLLRRPDLRPLHPARLHRPQRRGVELLRRDDGHRPPRRRPALGARQRLAVRPRRPPQAVHRVVLGRHVDRPGHPALRADDDQASSPTRSCSASASAPTSPSTSPS